jgi:hypothetical protein
MRSATSAVVRQLGELTIEFVAKQSRRSERPGYRIYREHPPPLAGILQAPGPPSARNEGRSPYERIS